MEVTEQVSKLTYSADRPSKLTDTGFNMPINNGFLKKRKCRRNLM